MKRIAALCPIIFILLSIPTLGFGGELGETISGRLTAGRYNWQYGYSITLFEDKLLVQVGIHFVPAPGVTRVQLAKVQPGWEKEIERVWSDRFALRTGNKTYPIEVDAVFKGPLRRHDVIVLPGGGRRSDELTWHIMDTPQTAAHEFGHMLGLYDEYMGGAMDPLTKITDHGSIMTSRPVAGVSRSRHYERLKQWFMVETGAQHVTLIPLDE